MKKRSKKLNLTRETVSRLDPEKLAGVGGQLANYQINRPFCFESINICSIVATCASCNGGTEL
jgi:hypothetical protein